MQQTIYQKINSLRKDVVTLDWSPDKKYILKGNEIHYVSQQKLARQFAPLWINAGLDFAFNIVGVKDYPDHVRIEVDFILTDIDSEQQDTMTVFADGECTLKDGAYNIKAIAIAMAYAYRLYLTKRFCIADGIELDTEEEQTESDFIENVRAKAIQEEEPKAESKPRIVTIPVKAKAEVAPKTVTLANTKKEIPVKEESPVESTENVPKTEDKVEKVSQSDKGKDNVKKPLYSEYEKNAADKSMRIITERYEKGQIVEDIYLKAKDIYEHMETSKDISDILNIKRETEGMVKE